MPVWRGDPESERRGPVTLPEGWQEGNVSPPKDPGEIPGLGEGQDLSPLQSLLVGQRRRGRLAENPYAYFGGI